MSPQSPYKNYGPMNGSYVRTQKQNIQRIYCTTFFTVMYSIGLSIHISNIFIYNNSNVCYPQFFLSPVIRSSGVKAVLFYFTHMYEYVLSASMCSAVSS